MTASSAACTPRSDGNALADLIAFEKLATLSAASSSSHGTVGRVLALRDDAFKTHFASAREDGRAVAFSTSSLGDIFPSFSNIGASNASIQRGQRAFMAR